MTPWITVAGWTLLHFLWQGALIAVAAWLSLSALRAATPQSRYLAASTALALMLLAPLVTASWLTASLVSATRSDTPALMNSPAVVVSSVGSAPRTVTNVTPGVPFAAAGVSVARLFAIVVGAWLLGVTLLLLRLVGGWWGVQRLQRAALAMPASRWQAISDQVAQRLRLRRRVHVIESSAVNTPAIIGWWRPVLLLPLTALAGLTPSQAEAIVAHELAHVRRHDYLVNVLQRVAETLLFYHPAVWWVSSRMRIEREYCCDAVAVRLCGDARDYALALVRLEETRAVSHPTLAMAAGGGALVDRIRRILNPLPDHRRSLAPAVMTVVTVLLFVVIAGGGYRRSLRTLEARGRTGHTVIATVNTEPITRADLDHFRPLHGEPANTPLDRVLVQLIDERLLVQRGRALGFTTEPAELQRALEGLKQQNHLATDAALEALLAKQHLTLADLTQHLRRSRVVFQVGRAEARNGLVITDQEAQQYFDAHLDQFPLQTFDLAKPDLVSRLTLEKLAHGGVPASYMQPLRSAAAIVWEDAALQRAYAEGLAGQAQAGTPVPGRLATPTADWRLTATDHFDIFATPDVAAQVGRVQQVAERAYQHVSTDLRHDLDVRPSLVLFATDAAARAANGATLPNTATPSQRTLLPLDQPDAFQATVTHEIAHTFEANIVPRATLAAVPTWIVEGLSEYEGGVWGASDQASLRDLVRTNAVPALSTVDATVGQGNQRLPYSLGHAAFDFIVARWGADGIRRLLLALRNGTVDHQTLYMTAWGVGADDVDRAFSAYLRVRFPALASAASLDLPACLQGAGLINVDFKDVTIPQVLTFLTGTCGINVRVENIPDRETSRIVPRVQFSQTTLANMFRFIVASEGWRYTVVDEKTLVLTRQ